MRPQVTGARLIVLVADNDMKEVVQALLSRPNAIGTTDFEFDVVSHPERDPGCVKEAAQVLRPHLNQYRYCMVMCDHHGCGKGEKPRHEIQQQVEEDLGRNGWKKHAKVIVIEPELEAWVWGDLATTSEKLGWPKKSSEMRQLLKDKGLWPEDQPKPPDPKKAMATALRCKPERRKIRRTPSLYRAIAESVTLDNCRDPAFRELRATLQRWFPAKKTP